MKRMRMLLVSVLLLCLVGCGGMVTIGGFSSIYFNNDDYDAAVQEVMTAFKEFEGCTLKKIEYAGDKAVKAAADDKKLAPEQIIVLTSTFTTDSEEHDNGFEPDQTYEGYTWILTRITSSDPFWTIEEHGLR